MKKKSESEFEQHIKKRYGFDDLIEIQSCIFDFEDLKVAFESALNAGRRAERKRIGFKSRCELETEKRKESDDIWRFAFGSNQRKKLKAKGTK